ncbi:uncharacterized protein METZ01_LOCUS466186, partial [marine metagenome]
WAQNLRCRWRWGHGGLHPVGPSAGVPAACPGNGRSCLACDAGFQGCQHMVRRVDPQGCGGEHPCPLQM